MMHGAVRVANIRRIVLAKPRLGIGVLAILLDQSRGVGFNEGAVCGATAKPREHVECFQITSQLGAQSVKQS